MLQHNIIVFFLNCIFIILNFNSIFTVKEICNHHLSDVCIDFILQNKPIIIIIILVSSIYTREDACIQGTPWDPQLDFNENLTRYDVKNIFIKLIFVIKREVKCVRYAPVEEYDFPKKKYI